MLYLFKKFINFIYIKLIVVNDSPQKIALGLGLGVFSGIFPGTGPAAALFLSILFRVNRASALLGSLFTNTWLSFVTFLLAAKTGYFIFGINAGQTYQDWLSLLRGLNLSNLLKLSILRVIFPLIFGYLVVAFSLGLIVYLTTLIIISISRHKQHIF